MINDISKVFFFFPALVSIKMKVSNGSNYFGSNLKANLRGVYFALKSRCH